MTFSRIIQAVFGSGVGRIWALWRSSPNMLRFTTGGDIPTRDHLPSLDPSIRHNGIQQRSSVVTENRVRPGILVPNRRGTTTPLTLHPRRANDTHGRSGCNRGTETAFVSA